MTDRDRQVLDAMKALWQGAHEFTGLIADIEPTNPIVGLTMHVLVARFAGAASAAIDLWAQHMADDSESAWKAVIEWKEAIRAEADARRDEEAVLALLSDVGFKHEVVVPIEDLAPDGVQP